MTTVKEFVRDAYQLVSSNTPTVPLQGNDEQIGIRCANRLLKSFASRGLMLTIAKTVSVPIINGQREVVCGPPTALPVPDITLGRLANMDSAWLNLSGVDYPLIDESRDVFLASFKYEPLLGLPRYIVVYPETDVVRLKLFPGASQGYNFFVRGKFQLTELVPTGTLDGLPGYFELFFLYACAKEIAYAKSRAAAWTPDLEQRLKDLRDEMESASEVNLTITGPRASLLNGAYRVKAGI